MQLLVAGCHDAVRLYRVHIDDASESSRTALAAAIQRVAAGEGIEQINLEESVHSPEANGDAPDRGDGGSQQPPAVSSSTYEQYTRKDDEVADARHLSVQLLAAVCAASRTEAYRDQAHDMYCCCIV